MKSWACTFHEICEYKQPLYPFLNKIISGNISIIILWSCHRCGQSWIVISHANMSLGSGLCYCPNCTIWPSHCWGKHAGVHLSLLWGNQCTCRIVMRSLCFCVFDKCVECRYVMCVFVFWINNLILVLNSVVCAWWDTVKYVRNKMRNLLFMYALFKLTEVGKALTTNIINRENICNLMSTK